MDPLISLIAPVYKVEPYLREALDSAVGQTYKNVEIILVDDGSPDNCGAICDEYAARDPRIKVIHQKNAGSGMARNAGLDIATGEYVAFFDPDDVMDLDLIEYLYHLSQSYDGAMAVCAIYTDASSKPQAKPILYCDTPNAIVREAIRTFHSGPAAKLYSRARIGSLRFTAHRRAQDTVFNYRYLCQLSAFVYSSEAKYHYRKNECSVTLKPFSEKNECDLFDAIDIVTDEFNRAHDNIIWPFICGWRCRILDEVHTKMKHAHVVYAKQPSYVQFLKKTRMLNRAYRHGSLCRKDYNSQAIYLRDMVYLKCPIWSFDLLFACISFLSRIKNRAQMTH